jgi:hypothetical protein
MDMSPDLYESRLYKLSVKSKDVFGWRANRNGIAPLLFPGRLVAIELERNGSRSQKMRIFA